MASVCWVFYISKFIELLDTVSIQFSFRNVSSPEMFGINCILQLITHHLHVRVLNFNGEKLLTR